MSLFDIRTSHAFPCLTLESLQNEELSVPSTISTSNRETRGRSLRQTGTSISGCQRQTGKSVRNGQPCPHIVLRRSRLHVAGCGVDVTYTSPLKQNLPTCVWAGQPPANQAPPKPEKPSDKRSTQPIDKHLNEQSHASLSSARKRAMLFARAALSHIC